MAAALHEQFASLENGCEADLEVCSSCPWVPYVTRAMHCHAHASSLDTAHERQVHDSHCML